MESVSLSLSLFLFLFQSPLPPSFPPSLPFVEHAVRKQISNVQFVTFFPMTQSIIIWMTKSFNYLLLGVPETHVITNTEEFSGKGLKHFQLNS